MRRLAVVSILFCCLGGLCGASFAGKLRVVTTLPSLASLAKSIGDGAIEVQSITTGAQDAHYVEAKPSYMVQLNKADLLIYSGLDLEIGWLPLLIQGARNPRVVVGAKGNLNAASAIPPEAIVERPKGEVDRSMGDVHPMGNPHYILNPWNALHVAELIAEKLIELDPDHKELYEKNAHNFKSLLEDSIKVWENRMANLRRQEVVCYHPHWSYLLSWMGISTVGYLEPRPGIPPTPKHKKEIIELIEARNIKAIIISTWREPTPAREVANQAQAKLLVLPGEVGAVPEASDYVSWISYLVRKIEQAFATF